MTGLVYDFDSLKVYIMSGEKRKIIFFNSDKEYEAAIKKGMKVGKQIIFDNKDVIKRFY